MKIRDTINIREAVQVELQEIQLACLTVADGLYAVDIMRVKEIIRMPRLAPLPGALPFVRGVANLRGEVITVVDLRHRLALPPLDSTEQARLLILALPGQRMGLVVDEVREMITVPVRDLKPPPRGGAVAVEHLLGLCLVQDQPVLILNIDSLTNLGHQGAGSVPRPHHQERPAAC